MEATFYVWNPLTGVVNTWADTAVNRLRIARNYAGLRLYTGTVVARSGGLYAEGLYTADLAEAKAVKLAYINNMYAASVAVVQEDTPQEEILTWDIQKLEAQAWKADMTVATPFIDGIAEGRGMAREELILRILENVAAYQTLVSVQTGKRQKYVDMLTAATTVEEVNAIKWEA